MNGIRRLALLVALLALPGFAGVPAKGTEILWDRYGIPHIFAPDDRSLFYAYGYAQMEAHSELLLRLYTQARGRGAEFYGESYLDSDRWVADLRADKLSTHVEMADHFVDHLVAQARKLGGESAKKAADILEKWDRQADASSDGTLLFYLFMMSAGPNFQAIGGYRVAPDDRQPLTTPRGFADPAKAAQVLEAIAKEVESGYGSLHVLWGDVLRLRRGSLDLPGNGAPSMLGAIRTVNPGPFVNGKAQGVSGDTYFAVIEFSNPVKAEALLGYGNWSRAGSKHVEDQLTLMSNKQMRPVWRARSEVEANLESRKTF